MFKCTTIISDSTALWKLPFLAYHTQFCPASNSHLSQGRERSLKMWILMGCHGHCTGFSWTRPGQRATDCVRTITAWYAVARSAKQVEPLWSSASPSLGTTSLWPRNQQPCQAMWPLRMLQTPVSPCEMPTSHWRLHFFKKIMDGFDTNQQKISLSP